MNPTVLIIGAGLAGLSAARRLFERGCRVRLIDKGRRPGGRLSSRLIGGVLYNHGAQFFTARSAEFQAAAAEWLARGLVRVWTHGFQDRDGHPRYVGVPSMNAVAAALAEGLDIECGVECASLWPLADSFDAVILTPPVPQSIAIAGRSFPELDRIRYDRCIALMVEGGWLDRPAAGVRQIPDGEPVAWIADEASRAGLAGGRSRAITIHSGAQFALDYWDQPPEAAAAILLPAAGIEPGAVWHYHRWKFAKPAVLHPERCFVQELARPAGGGIVSVFAGDAFGEPRVEGAVLSGWAAADALSRAF